MKLAEISIKRPIFITCLISLMIVLGIFSFNRMPVDMFPDVSFPIVFVQVVYPGASPVDVERQVSKVIEDELSSLPGLDELSSNNFDSVAFIVAKFKIGIDIKDSEQQVRNRIQNILRDLPVDVQPPVIRRFDPADQAIMTLAINANLPEGELYDLAYERVKPFFERIQDIGLVDIVGGRKKEIQVLVDKKKLQERELSMLQVAKRITETSKDIPVGKVENSKTEMLLRSVGEFKDIKQIEKVAVNFLGSDRSVLISEIATVKEGLETATRYSSIDGKPALFLEIYKQSGANTVAVAERVKKQIEETNKFLEGRKIDAKISLVRDGSVPITLNVADVKESIFIGIVLCVLVVFFFLGSARSTFITGLALPNSFLGGFIIMYALGFSINVMTLIALSLAVGLLIDDAIVVRENIFRHLEMGKTPVRAAIEGTSEVGLAVIATTLVVIAVFGPIAFVPGMIGQFFKQFGLTVVATMMVSLFDAFTVAPMLSAYLATRHEHVKGDGPIGKVLKVFDRFQTWLEDIYEASLRWTLNHKKTILISATVIFILSIYLGKFISKTFMPPNDIGEFMVAVEMPIGTSLEGTKTFADGIEKKIKELKEVELISKTIGSNANEANKASLFIKLVDKKHRKKTTTDVKTDVRELLTPFNESAILAVSDVDMTGGGQKPFNLYLVGENLDELAAFANNLQEHVKKVPGLVDVDTNFRAGKPEFRVVFDRQKSEALGVSTATAGAELRYRTEGVEAAVYRQDGIEYKVRVRFPDETKDLRKEFDTTLVPNVNFNMIPLRKIATADETTGYSQINRQNKGRFIALSANVGPGGQLGNATDDVIKILENDVKPPLGVTYKFEGQAKEFQDLIINMVVALLFGVLMIYLVLSSLYESFVTPVTILLALPLAVSGAFASLFIFNKSIDLFSIIGLVLLMGVVAKNSILLVDYTKQLLDEGMEENKALITASRIRLRPILMTSLALIAGMLPIAIGLTELGTQRQSMGIAIIGGVISSTLLTLIVVPAAFGYIESFRVWSIKILVKLRGDDAIMVNTEEI